MLAPFDIFKCESKDKVMWMCVVEDLEIAKAKIDEFMKTASCDYLIVSLKTQRTMRVTPPARD